MSSNIGIDRGADIVVTSASLSEEQLRKALEASGYGDVKTEVQTYGKAPAEAPPAGSASAEPVADVEPQATEPAPRKSPDLGDSKIQKLDGGLKAIKSEREKERQAREKIEREMAELRARVDTPPVAVAPPAPVVPAGPDLDETPATKPQRADYFDADDPDEAYQDALVDYKLAEKERQQRLAVKEKAKQEAAQKAQEDARKRQEIESARKAAEDAVEIEYRDSLKSARERHSDWDAVMKTPGELCSPAMGHAIRASANAEILYWLGTHPEDAKRICAATKLPENASPAQAERVMRKVHKEFDKIESELKPRPRAATTPSVSQTKKYAPLTPVGNRRGAVTKTLAQMSPAEIRILSSDQYRKLRGA